MNTSNLLTRFTQPKFLKKILISHYVEDDCDDYFDRIESINDKYLRNLFLHTITIGKACVLEFLVLLNENKYFFNGNEIFSSQKSAVKSASVALKWISLYHLIKFLNHNSDKRDKNAVRAFAPQLFELSRSETSRLNRFLAFAADNETEFEIAFSKFFAASLFENGHNVGKNTFSPLKLAIIDNFLYNSYNDFYNSLTGFFVFNTEI